MNENNKYDEYFLSFNYDHCGEKEDKLDELVNKWKLTIKLTTEGRYEMVETFHNDKYTIVLTRSYYYYILSFSKNVSMDNFIEFFSDWKDCLDHYDDESVTIGLTGCYMSHPAEILKAMIDNLYMK